MDEGQIPKSHTGVIWGCDIILSSGPPAVVLEGGGEVGREKREWQFGGARVVRRITGRFQFQEPAKQKQIYP